MTLVAVADLDPNRRVEAEQAGVRATADADTLLSRPDLDAVVIAVPPIAHAAVACSALDRGRHVYLEKPLAASLADGQAILDAAPLRDRHLARFLCHGSTHSRVPEATDDSRPPGARVRRTVGRHVRARR